MNQSQFMSLVKTLLGAAGGFAVAKGWADTDTVTALMGAAMLIAPLVWGLISHTDAANALTTAAVSGVTVTVAPSASPAMRTLAADPAVKAVIPLNPDTPLSERIMER